MAQKHDDKSLCDYCNSYKFAEHQPGCPFNPFFKSREEKRKLQEVLDLIAAGHQTGCWGPIEDAYALLHPKGLNLPHRKS